MTNSKDANVTPDQGTAAFGGSVGLTVGLFHNNATGHIDGDARVDADGAIAVTATNTNRIDPRSLWFAALITPFRTDDGTTKVNPGDTVEVKPRLHRPGDIGARYAYLGTEPQTIDLKSADFTGVSLWEETDPVKALAKQRGGGDHDLPRRRPRRR